MSRTSVLFGLVVALSLAMPACRRAPAEAAGSPSVPTLRLYVVSSVAGAIEPCGCTKDMLGGVDHAAAFIAREAKEAPHALVLGAGPMLFSNPRLDDLRATQEEWKAEAMARSFADIGLVAWAPGANDWAAGSSYLRELLAESRADVLAANLGGDAPSAKATRLVDVNGIRVGLAGVSDPKSPLGTPAGVDVRDPKAALAEALSDLRKKGAQVFVALVAAERGAALRLAEQVPGFQVFVVGKPYDQGEGNDGKIPPTLVDDTLVVQGPNHLQGMVVVDLFSRGAFDFKDGTGIDALERRESLEARIRDLSRSIERGGAEGASAADVLARRADLDRAKKDLERLSAPSAPPSGSFFRYRIEEIRERLGTNPLVEKRLADYYRRVNDHNRDAFKDRMPPPARKGDATYIGGEACGNCHEAAEKFWQNTPHARAYESLSKQHKEFNLDCVSCHVTGYEKPGGSTVTHVASLMNVQCEVCHGPGSRHEDDPKDTSALVRSPPKTLCAESCHHPPHVPDGWSADEGWKVIVGKGHGVK